MTYAPSHTLTHKVLNCLQAKVSFKILFSHTSPIEPTVTNCDISHNNSLLKCVIADVTRK